MSVAQPVIFSLLGRRGECKCLLQTGKTDNRSIGGMMQFGANGNGDVGILATFVADVLRPAIVAGNGSNLCLAGILRQLHQKTVDLLGVRARRSR